MPDPLQPPLTAAQREIMEVIWDRGEATVSEVREALAGRRDVSRRGLGRRRDLARNTIHTMIVRLEEKGWLKHRDVGRKFLYSANVPRSTSLGAKVVQLVDRFFAGSPEEMVSALVEYRGLSADEAARIRAMIDKAQANKPQAKSKQSDR